MPSSDERERAVARLSAAFADDVLSMEEFERRVADAYRAPTTAALDTLVSDLPRDATAVGGAALVSAVPMSPRLAVVFGSVERGGRLAVPPRLDFRAVLGNIELDLREAQFGPGVTELTVYAVAGNVEIRLPAHVAIENHGEAFIGSFAARVRGGRRGGRDLPTGSPTRVRITGRAVFGNVEIEREPVDEG